MIATERQKGIFRSLEALCATINLGVIDPQSVNVVVHGHEPVLSEMIVLAAEDLELVARAKVAGAQGIRLSGICCTANELLMRQGIASAGSFLHPELALVTGRGRHDGGGCPRH